VRGGGKSSGLGQSDQAPGRRWGSDRRATLGEGQAPPRLLCQMGSDACGRARGAEAPTRPVIRNGNRSVVNMLFIGRAGRKTKALLCSDTTDSKSASTRAVQILEGCRQGCRLVDQSNEAGTNPSVCSSTAPRAWLGPWDLAGTFLPHPSHRGVGARTLQLKADPGQILAPVNPTFQDGPRTENRLVVGARTSALKGREC